MADRGETTFERDAALGVGRRVLREQSEAVGGVVLGEGFGEVVRRLATARGAVLVSGLGKSGIVGEKIAATLSSLDVPAFFVHSSECFHGDLGRFRAGDVAVLLSNSGATPEVVQLAQLCRARGVGVVALTAEAGSPLGRAADEAVAYGKVAESCAMGLAPTTSTTVQLAVGDAVAVAVSEARGLTEARYGENHPRGSLGMAGLTLAQVVRYKAGQTLALIDPATPIREAFTLSEHEASPMRRPGAIVVADPGQKLVGLFTDGDLRRAFLEHGPGVWEQPIRGHMTHNPTAVRGDQTVKEAIAVIERHRFDELPVVDGEGRAVALLDIQDLMALSLFPA
ncbi:MAG: SIS domain-containing protein [Planctomycetota bacterium]